VSAQPETGVPAQRLASPTRALLDEALGSFGKVVAALAGAGLFLYLIGAAVLWQRVDRAGLQAQEIVAAIPRDQLAVAGARDALLSLVAAALFGVFLYACYRLFRKSQQAMTTDDGIRDLPARWMRDRPALVVTTVVGIAFAPLVPLSASSVLFLALFLANLFLGARSAHRSLIGELRDFRTSLVPWLRVATGLTVAVFLVSVWRPSEFPDPFPSATVTLLDAAVSDDETGADKGKKCGLYLGSTSDAIILATSLCAPTAATTEAATVVARDRIANIELTRNLPEEPSASLLQRLVGVQAVCIPPVCQLGHERYTVLQPFAGETTCRRSSISTPRGRCPART
jgi:hypothetical protein